jgi:3-phenylpropionate/trans-cinnamate dioxygenase ferredoxin reductase subunit
MGLFLIVLVVPLLARWVLLGTATTSFAEEIATATGLLAMSVLFIALVMPARLRSLMATLGIEKILRGHRILALAALGLVAAHVVLVLFTDPRGLAIFDFRDTTAAAWAGSLSALAFAIGVGLALRRRRRRPRYEGWRLLHIALAALVVVAAFLHVWWLDNLVDNTVFGAWFLLLAAATLVIASRRWVWLPWRAHRRSYLLEEVRPEAGDAVTLVMHAHGHTGRPFAAGQFAWLKIGSSSFVFEEHPFTIASTAEQPHRKTFTIKALGDFSELLRGLRPGRRVFLDGPYGGFTIDGLDKSEGFVLIAGGVGITPMLSMLRTLTDRHDKRHHHLLVGARTVDELMLRSEIDELRDGLDLAVTEVIEAPPKEWGGETGRIDTELLERCLPRHYRHHDYFLCGPPPMVVAVGQQLRENGIPPRRIHTEQFDVV